MKRKNLLILGRRMPIACQTVQDLECKFKTYKVIPVFVDSAVNLVFLVSANAFEDHSSQSRYVNK